MVYHRLTIILGCNINEKQEKNQKEEKERKNNLNIKVPTEITEIDCKYEY